MLEKICIYYVKIQIWANGARQRLLCSLCLTPVDNGRSGAQWSLISETLLPEEKKEAMQDAGGSRCIGRGDTGTK